MAKKIIQDILVKKHPPVAQTRRPPERIELPPRPSRAPSSGRSWKPAFWFLLVVVPLGLFLFISTIFGTVQLDISPREEMVTLDALPLTLVKSPDQGHVHYEVMTVAQEASLAVPATESQKVSRKARGTLVVYNAFDTKVQKLVAGTRFQAMDGKIYKADSPVAVPGGVSSGGQLTPGSVEVAVTAAEAGEAYNQGLGDFTIPGFAGTPRFKGFYARSKTELAGGFEGTMVVPKDTDVLDARHKLETSLHDTLLAKAKKGLADGYLFFAGSDFYDFTFLPTAATSTASGATVNGKGTLTGIIVERASLARAIAKAQVAGYGAESVDLANPDSLDIAFDNKSAIDLTKDVDIAAKWTGKAHLIWTFDETDLKNALVGIGKNDYQAVFQKYPAIERSSVTFSPPWLMSFPAKASQITVTQKLQKQ